MWKGVSHVPLDYGFFGEMESEEQVTLVLVIRVRRQNDVVDAGSGKGNLISMDCEERSEVH